jgi:hypothetical protein
MSERGRGRDLDDVWLDGIDGLFPPVFDQCVTELNPGVAWSVLELPW